MTEMGGNQRAPSTVRPVGEPPAPPAAIVRELRASLRASDVYVSLVIDRLELASASDPRPLERVPSDAVVQLSAASEALQAGATRILAHLSPTLAARAEEMAELMRERVYEADDPLQR